MKRLLTYEETNFVKAALQFFKENGPEEVQVANYYGSYPNNPEKAIRKMKRFDADKISDIFEDGPTTYDEIIKKFVMVHPDDYWDHKTMAEALERTLVPLKEKLKDFEETVINKEYNG